MGVTGDEGIYRNDTGIYARIKIRPKDAIEKIEMGFWEKVSFFISGY